MPTQPRQAQCRTDHAPALAWATYTAEAVSQPSCVPSEDQARAGRM